MAHILDERNRENSLCDDSYAAHNDLGLQLPAFEMSLRPPPGFDDRLQRTSTTQHADTDPLLMDTETAPSESNDREASLKLSSKIRYNPITPAGRQQIKQAILRSGAGGPEHAHQLKAKSPGRYSGWRMGSMISCILTGLSLLIILASLFFGVRSGSPSAGVGTIFTGSCDKVKRLDLWLHVVINILGTILIAASNFNMQCLNAPNRKEVDAAHAKGYWLDIGVLSIRNYLYMSRRKKWLWGLLAFSTIPLHLFLNSAIFSTLQTNDYLVTVVSRDFLQDDFIDCSGSTQLPYSDVICSMYAAAHDKDNSEVTLKRLDPGGCMEQYANLLQNQYSNVIAVSRNASNSSTIHTANHLNSSTLLDASTNYGVTNSWNTFLEKNYNLTEPWNPMRWTCVDDAFVVCDLGTTLDHANYTGVNPNPEWTIHNDYIIDYCLASTVKETCKLKIHLNIVGFVVISTTVKLVAMIFTLTTLEDDQFITIGDAIASFLETPDPNTKGGCLAMKIDLQRSFFKARKYFLGDNTGNNQPYEFLRLFCLRVETAWEPVPNVEVSLRWYQAPSNKRWLICMLACFSALLVTGILYHIGVKKINLRQSIWTLGFGSLTGNALINKTPSNNSLMGMVLLANLPQLVLAVLYFMYNSTFTCMLAAAEWSRYGQHRKGLRVTSPTHAQRSTYWLQLPWSYGLPLAIISSVLHWLVSQSIFLANFDVYDPRNNMYDPRNNVYDPKKNTSNGGGFGDDSGKVPSNISDCGYSPPAIVCLLIVGSIMVLVLVLHGLRKLDPGMPIAGSCSLAISAACHRPPGDVNAALSPVKWGAVSHETKDGPGHCCFTSFEVESPIVGHEYAG